MRLPRHTTALFYGVLLLLIVAAIWPWSRDRNRFQTGMAAAMDQNYVRAAELWRPLAERGYALAQYNLAILYEEGRGLPRDPLLAAVWYRRAADQNMPLAKLNLGLMYLRGAGVAENHPLAAQLIQEAAAQGNAKAQNNLGQMYWQGLGVIRDAAAAVRWFQAAARQGNIHAQLSLAERYRLGEGVANDAAASYIWYAVAAARGAAAVSVNRDRMARSLSAEALADANARAEQLLRQMPSPGVPDKPWEFE